MEGLPEVKKNVIYVVDNSKPAARTLMEKLCNNCKPGAVILVTKEEFEVLKAGVIQLEVS